MKDPRNQMWLATLASASKIVGRTRVAMSNDVSRRINKLTTYHSVSNTIISLIRRTGLYAYWQKS